MPAKDEINTTDKAIGILASSAFWLLINSICFLLKIKNRFQLDRHAKHLTEEPQEIGAEINMLNKVRS